MGLGLVPSWSGFRALLFEFIWGPRFYRRTELFRGAARWVQGRRPFDLEPHHLRLKDHAIIAGYGLNGRNLARVLKGAEIPDVVVDMSKSCSIWVPRRSWNYPLGLPPWLWQSFGETRPDPVREEAFRLKKGIRWF